MKPAINKAFEDEMRRRIEEVRKGIKIKETVAALQDCVEGVRELTREQIRAAEILLKKSMPDLKEIEHKVDANTDLAEYLSKARDRAAARTTQH